AGGEQGPSDLPARRQAGALWRTDGGAGAAAGRRLHQDQAGGLGSAAGRGDRTAGRDTARPAVRIETAAMSDLDTGHASSSRLWLLATVAAVALHLGGAALALTSFKND